MSDAASASSLGCDLDRWLGQGSAALPLAGVPQCGLTVGLVTPSYGQAAYLEACLRSVLLQTHRPLAYVVMDGGSRDGSAGIIARYADHLAYWTSAPDGGQSDAIDRGIAKLDAEVVGWLNSDDLLLPGALAKVAAYFEAHPECAWLCGDGVFAYEPGLTGDWVKRPTARTTRDLLMYGRDDWLPQPSVFFRKSLYEAVGGLRHDLHYAMDLDLWLRMSRHAPLHYLPTSLSVLRQHGDAKTLRDNARAMREVEQVIAAHARDQPLHVRASARCAMRRRRALASCAEGLARYFADDQPGASTSLREAARLFPPIVGSRSGAQLWLRLALPLSVRGVLFHRP